MKKIPMENISALFSEIAKLFDLFVPQKSGGKTNFMLYSDGDKVDFDTLKSAKSPKDVFFPQSETLYSVSRKEGKLKITPAELINRPFVLFGVRACDAAAFDVLDRVFLSEPQDTFYKSRREQGIVVSLSCKEPEETCFCTAFGIDPASPAADTEAHISDGVMYLSAKTEKGERLISKLDAILEDTNSDIVDSHKENINKILKELPYSSLSLVGWGEAGSDRFDSPLWGELYKPCLACGTCTFVCPTCQCYDIKDYNTGADVLRYRCWDSCMYSDFTKMSHGNNRTSQRQRFRQRFMHKLVYYPTNNDGLFSCVGCGRCVSSCPSGLNIVKVIKAFNKNGGKG